MLKLSVELPAFLHRILPAWLRSDLERRSAFNGKASRSFLAGIITVQAEQVLDEGKVRH